MSVIERRPIFQAVKQLRGGRAFTLAEVRLLDAAIDEAMRATETVTPADEADAFPAALVELLKHEGGYVNHKDDPGGRTNLGVTQRVWEAWTGKKASEADMRALTPAMVAPLYRKHYWDAVRADDLLGGLALTVFDFGVNAGPSRAIKFLQQMVGAMVDGIPGPMTIAAVRRYVEQHGEAWAIRAYSDLRREYYRTRATFRVFGKGWLRRVDAVEKAALELAE